MQVQTYDLEWYSSRISLGEPFSFVRYGNGEWDCILGLYHQTRSGSQAFTPDLREALADTLKVSRSEPLFYASQSTSYLNRLGLMPKIDRWLSENRVRLSWHEGETFHKASEKGRLGPFIKSLKKRQVVVVGPPWLQKLPFSKVFMPVRKKNCWQDHEILFEELRSLDGTVVSFSAGPTAKVLIHKLYPLIGDSCWLLDMGSLWDPYCGVRSRRYHKRVTAEILKKNLQA